jgi:DNA polymerase-3 subunit epsilon
MTSGLPAAAETYLASVNVPVEDSISAEAVRFVVLDTETTGLDPRRDRLITIGAVEVAGGDILTGNAFEVMLKVAYNNSSVTVHGVTRDEARAGMDEAEAVAEFLDYLGNGVITGHHIGHDVETLSQATLRHWGFRLENKWLDTMDLALLLEADGVFREQPLHEGFSLDSLCARFGVEPHDRHTAGGDALMTALVFVRLKALARRAGRTTLGDLRQPPPA